MKRETIGNHGKAAIATVFEKKGCHTGLQSSGRRINERYGGDRMLIVSQNGQTMLQMEQYAITAEKIEGIVKITASDADMDYLLGEYQGMGGAKKALNELREAYLKYKFLKMCIKNGVNIGQREFKTGMIFQMP